MPTHTFRKPCLALLQYYSSFLDEEKIPAQMKQLAFPMSDYIAAIREVSALINKNKIDKTNYTKEETVIPKLYRYLDQLSGVKDLTTEFVINWSDLGCIPGNHRDVVHKSANILASVLDVVERKVSCFDSAREGQTT